VFYLNQPEVYNLALFRTRGDIWVHFVSNFPTAAQEIDSLATIDGATEVADGRAFGRSLT
jgi:hypothetical protein